MLRDLTAEQMDRNTCRRRMDRRVMAKVDESVSIREEASTDAAVVGKFFKGMQAIL